MDEDTIETSYYTESVVQDATPALPTAQYVLAPPPLPPLPPPPPPPPSSPYPTSPSKISPQPAKKPAQPAPVKKAQHQHVCRDFIRGRCDRSPCRFLHAVDDKTLTEVTKFCHDHQNKGCKRDNCKFIHCTIKEQTVYYNTGKLPAAAFDMIRKQEKNAASCKNGDACAFLHSETGGEMPPMTVPPPPIAACPPPPKPPQPAPTANFGYPPPVETPMRTNLMSAIPFCTVPPPPPADMPPRDMSDNTNLLLKYDQKLQKISQMGLYREKCSNCAVLEKSLQEKEKTCAQVILEYDECCKEKEKYMQNILNSFIILNEQAPMSVPNVLSNIIPEFKKLGSSSDGLMKSLQNALLSFNVMNMTQNNQTSSNVLQQLADKIMLNNLLNSLQTSNFPQTNVYSDYTLNLLSSLMKPVQQRPFPSADPFLNVSQQMATSQPMGNLQYTKADQTQKIITDSNKSLNNDFSTHASQLLAEHLRSQNFPPIKDMQLINSGSDVQTLPFNVENFQNETFMSMNDQLIQNSKQTLSNNNATQSLIWQQQMMSSAQPNPVQQYVTAGSIGAGQQYANVNAPNPLGIPNTQQNINASTNQVNPNSYQRIVPENVSTNSQMMGPQYVPFNTMPTSHQLGSGAQAQLLNQMTNPLNSSSQMIPQNQNQQTNVTYSQSTLQH